MEGSEAQDMSKMQAEPHKEHEWLQKLVGEWVYEGGADMGPDKPAEKFTGTESVRSLGGLWFVAEGKGTMPDGSEATTLLTVGYDPRQQRYVGTWIGSMMTHLWVYDGGELDADGRTLTLHAEGPDMAAEGKMARYKDVIEFKSDDHRVLTGNVQGDDGSWRELMSVQYRRQK